MYSTLMHALRLVKKFHDIGIYEKAVGHVEEISEDDYYELALLGLECVAPEYDREELGEDVCCGGHIIHHFSDPAIPEYYRLCRLYEHQHSKTPAENPYVKKALDYFRRCINCTNCDVGFDFNDEVHVREILIETCPERSIYEDELVELVYDVLEFYRNEVEVLRAELTRGPIVWLPALPAHEKQKKQAKKPRKAANKPITKAS